MLSMGEFQDPKMEVRKRTIFLAIYILWGYSLKFRPNKYKYAKKCSMEWVPPMKRIGS